MRLSHLALLLICALPFLAAAQTGGEVLLQKVPPGYKIAAQTRQGNAATTQLVPEGESLQTWSETIAVTVFLGEKNATIDQFQKFSLARWLSGCPGIAGAADIKSVSKGIENSYPFEIWSVACKRASDTAPSEFAWFKAIKGNDSFYVIQKSFRKEPSLENITAWVKYLEKLSVCDTRLLSQSC